MKNDIRLDQYSLVEDHYWGGKMMFGGTGHVGEWVKYEDVLPFLKELQEYREKYPT